MQEVAVTRDSAGSNLTQMHNERKNNDEWGKLVHLQADMEKESVKKMKAQNDDIMKQLRYENGMINRAKMERERNLRSLDHSIDKDEAKDPKNVNLLPFIDDSRVKTRKEYMKSLRKENNELNIEKMNLKEYQNKMKLIDRENQNKFSKATKNMEHLINKKNKMESIEMANFWKKQQQDSQKAREMEKVKDIEDGKKYFKWVNDFAENYNHERFKIYEKGDKTSSISPHNKNRKFCLNSANSNELGSSNYSNNANGYNQKNQDSNISIRTGSDAVYEDVFKNDYTSGKVLREKFKHKYIEDLNQQLEEKKLRKQREKLMDPREKIMNQKYMTDLANGKDANPNPILSNSHLKMKLDRNKSRDQMTLDNSMMYSPNTPLDGYTNSSHLVIPNRSKSNIRMNNFDTITPGNSTGRKDNLSRIALPQRKLIMNTGNNVLGNGSIHSSQVDRKIDRDSLKNYQAKNRRSSNQTFDSFGRLGFKDNTKNDPSFNAHYEYNLRKSPIGRSLNNSVDNIRMNDLKINNPTVRNKVQISKRASVEEMIKSRPQVDNISNLVFCQKQ
ncbi:unnamed protein product [Moneuplotes crassus]|uniref:Uncharacterized protein n=1 Tax=Euplotes crassus TaxID=5936 RepID=A0AAD1U3G4_EUPCR|nr:unnamed protein product [Moneuplotes crassus]